MSIKTRATIEDLYKVEGKAELVNGEIVEMPPAGEDPALQVWRLLSACMDMLDVRAKDGYLGMAWDSM